MKKIFIFFFILFLGTSTLLHGQFFQETFSTSGNDLVFSIRPFPGGGNITTDWSDIEFFVRHSTSALPLSFGAITVNTAQFPGVVITYNGANIQGEEAGFVNHWFGTSFSVGAMFTYTDGQTYEVFRVEVSVNPTTIGLELIHNDPDFSPHYTALTSGTGGLDKTAPTGPPNNYNKFFGPGTSICGPINCPATTPGNNHRYSFGALPLQLLSFSATRQDENSLLTWETANERAVKHFNIERSIDGNTWKQIGQIAAKNETGMASNYYELTDEDVATKNPAVKTFYYRLQSVDLDGSSAFAPIRTVQFDKTGTATIYPNPFRSQIFINTDIGGHLKIRVYDITGRLFLEQYFESNGSAQIIPVTFAQSLPAAPFILEISDHNGVPVNRALMMRIND
jgi:hypothetical protein